MEAERIDRIEQQRVLGRDDEGRRNRSEEGKDKNATPKEGMAALSSISLR
jgi:hypothetical protein